MICGFTWKTDHICECIAEDEHEEYHNARHFCGCGEKLDCRYGEQSYEPTPTLPLMDAAEDEVPF